MDVLNFIWSLSNFTKVYIYVYSTLGFNSRNAALITIVTHRWQVADTVQ